MPGASHFRTARISEGNDETWMRSSHFDVSGSSPWYDQPCFERYWKHYNQVMTWCRVQAQRHREAQQYYSWLEWTQGQEQNQHHRRHMNFSRRADLGKKEMDGDAITRRNDQRQFKSPKNNLEDKRRHDASGTNHAAVEGGVDVVMEYQCDDDDHVEEEEAEEEEDCCSQNDSDVVEMHITDDMLDFFSQSLRHKQQRDAAKAATKDTTEEKRVDLASRSFQKTQADITTQAPTERPGSRRTAEMKELYGKGAAMIHGMETAMQLTFDRNCDHKQPKLWPNMPFNIKFS